MVIADIGTPTLKAEKSRIDTGAFTRLHGGKLKVYRFDETLLDRVRHLHSDSAVFHPLFNDSPLHIKVDSAATIYINRDSVLGSMIIKMANT